MQTPKRKRMRNLIERLVLQMRKRLICTDKENTDQNGKPIRNRKRKTYGDEFEETNKEGNDGMFYI